MFTRRVYVRTAGAGSMVAQRMAKHHSHTLKYRADLGPSLIIAMSTQRLAEPVWRICREWFLLIINGRGIFWWLVILIHQVVISGF